MNDLSRLFEQLLEGPMSMPTQYMQQLNMPLAYQNPPDTPHPGSTLQARMKGQWGKENPDEVAEQIMQQEMIRDIISKHLYYQRGANEVSDMPSSSPSTRGMTGSQIPDRLGRDAPMYDPLMEMLESLDTSDVPMY